VNFVKTWSLFVLFLFVIVYGARLLPPAADTPFLKHGAGIDHISFQGVDITLLGLDGSSAALRAETLAIEHLTLGGSLLTARRGLVAHDLVLLTSSGSSFEASVLELTQTEGHHRWQGPATLTTGERSNRYQGRGELWLEGGGINVVELKP
jgi:hypothetical protein